MNERIKDLWVNALKSGEYKQTTDLLTDGEGGYCCLGVLCDVYIKENGLGEEEAIAIFERHTILPPYVADWAGIESNPVLLGNDRASFLNDEGFSFERIAELIRVKL